MQFQYNDGGRAAAGLKGTARDCVVRAIAIALERPYQEVYESINILALDERVGCRKKHKSDSEKGVYRRTYEKYLRIHGWKWIPTKFIGEGVKVHLKDGELPMGRIIARVSKHVTCIIDGVIHDTGCDTRGGTRAVYGYFVKA